MHIPVEKRYAASALLSTVELKASRPAF